MTHDFSTIKWRLLDLKHHRGSFAPRLSATSPTTIDELVETIHINDGSSLLEARAQVTSFEKSYHDNKG